MKRLFVILLIVLSTIWIPFVSHSGTQFYVATNGNDANDGSLAAPWRTIQKGAQFKNRKEALISFSHATTISLIRRFVLLLAIGVLEDLCGSIQRVD